MFMVETRSLIVLPARHSFRCCKTVLYAQLVFLLFFLKKWIGRQYLAALVHKPRALFHKSK